MRFEIKSHKMDGLINDDPGVIQNSNRNKDKLRDQLIPPKTKYL